MGSVTGCLAHSDFVLYPRATADAEIRILRSGNTFGLYYRDVGAGSWTLAREHLRPELPATLQVGIMSYSTPSPPDVLGIVDEIVFTVP